MFLKFVVIISSMSFSSSFYVNYGGVGPSLKGQISKRENYFKIGIQWRSLDFGAPWIRLCA